MRAPSAIDQANLLVRHLGDQVGIPSLCLDERSTCVLLVARRWLVTLWLDAAHDTLYLSIPITKPEQVAQVPVGAWVALLQMQHLGGNVHGASVSVDPKGQICVQQALYLPPAVPADLVSATELLLGRAGQWVEKIAQSQEASPLQAAAAPASRLHHARI